MKIYFAGSITGGRQDAGLYQEIIAELANYGTVLTEHVGDEKLSDQGEVQHTKEYIYTRDLEWLTASDVVVAEVSTTSLGVGYEIGKAEDMQKRILCLYRPGEGRRLSAMIAGNKTLDIKEYQTIEDVKKLLESFFLRK